MQSIWRSRIISLMLFSLTIVFLTGCSDDIALSGPQIDRIQGYTMGTVYNISWVHQPNISNGTLKNEVDAALKLVNQQMSTYQADSELSRLNQTVPPVTLSVSPPLAAIIQQSLDLHDFTNGYFDISVGPIVNLWGFGPEEMKTKAPSDEAIKAAKARVGLDAVKVLESQIIKRADRYLDLSAIAKGYGVDVIADLLEANNIEHYLVEIGGEIRVAGEKAEGLPWKIAIETPDTIERQGMKALEMKTGALATSGDYRNYFEVDGQRFSHTIDPFTARPITHKLASVTVLDKTSARADALATAMLVMGEKRAVQFAEAKGIAAYFIVRDGEVFRELQSSAFNQWFSVKK